MILYITYDGVLEPLPRSQVLGYLFELAKNHRIILLSYEKKKNWLDGPLKKEVLEGIRNAGIYWVPLRYHKNPTMLATLYDLFLGYLVSVYLVLRYRVRLVHTRGDMPSIVGLILKKILTIKVLLDMRGFWAEERVRSGSWRRDSKIFYLAKWFEQKFLLNADVTVVLTRAATKVIAQYSYWEKKKKKSLVVIPTCANLEIFHPRVSTNKRNSSIFTLGYVGAAGIYAFDQVLEFYKALKQFNADSHLLILNREEHDWIYKKLKEHSMPKKNVTLKSAAHKQVAEEMSHMNAGIFFLNQDPSLPAVAPTRFAEFLGCGIPCICNDGIGDVSEILEGEQVGIVLRELNHQAFQEGILRLTDLCKDPELATRCTNAARKHFSLEKGVEAYHRIYENIAS